MKIPESLKDYPEATMGEIQRVNWIERRVKTAKYRPDRGAELQRMCVLVGLPEPVREHRFHPKRKWRFDLAWPAHMLALEIDGGAFIGGRHTSGAGFRKDCEKMSHAAILGWRVLRVLPEQVPNGIALSYCMAALEEE